MTESLFFQMSERMALVITIAFLMTRVKMLRRLLHQNINPKEKIALSLIFGIIAIFGTYSAVEIQGALANSRVIGPVVAGLLGGPMMGGAAGLVSGLHRWSLGGFTGFACALSTFSEGILAGLIKLFLKDKRIGWNEGLITGVIAESMQMVILLLVAKPYEAALDLVKVIAAPMIIWNSIGIAIFMLIIRSAQEEEERIGALQTQKALTIADATLCYLRRGLSNQTAEAVAQVIKNHTNLSAVSITDTNYILAHVGEGSDHHLPGQPILTEATHQVLSTGIIIVAQTKEEIGCPHPGCTMKSAVLVPLSSQDQVMGALKLYHNKEGAVNPIDVEFARGLSHLFSNQLEIAALEKQSKLLKEAELAALQAQVNPHFLFNALNTIISFSRSDPEMSRNLLRNLGDFFRKSLLKDKKLITLTQELERIDAYLSIEQARFGSRLQVFKDIDPETLNFPLPPLLLQPLVENCVKHGILPKPEGGVVFIKTRHSENHIKITIEDNGVGMNSEFLSTCLKDRCNNNGIGLVNVNDRLVNMYGPQTSLLINSQAGKGTIFSMDLPIKHPEGGQMLFD